MIKIRTVSLLVASVALLACTSQQSLQQLTDLQRDTESFLWEQAEQIQSQQEQLERLEEENQMLSEHVFLLQQDLDALRGRLPGSKEVAASSEKPKKLRNPSKKGASTTTASGKVVLGRMEWVWFDLFNRSVDTRVDTGVRSSVIYAKNVRLFERDGDEWVRFSFAFPSVDQEDNKLNEPQDFEVPVVKKLKVRGQSGDSEKRIIVSLRMKLGELVDDSQFVLSSKDDGSFGILLGRSFLRDIAVVDVAKKYTQHKFNE